MQTTEARLSWYGRLLMDTTDSMTKTLELIHDTKLKVHVIDQKILSSDHCPDFFKEIIAGACHTDDLVIREALLSDMYSETRYLYAVSLIVKANLTPELETGFSEGLIPIGKIIDHSEIETFRKVLKKDVVYDERINRILGIDPDEAVIYKVYSISRDGRPMLYIAEFFRLKDLSAQK